MYKKEDDFLPSYLSLNDKEFDQRIKDLYKVLENCTLCPRNCKVNRKKEKGYCQAGIFLKISSFFPHFGEEEVLSGWKGSGTIFFSHCNLRCLYCQNYEISVLGRGKEVSEEECAKTMIELQEEGCHNINFVTPTHFVPQILKSIKIAKDYGLKIPLVYNCGGYENIKTIKFLKGVIDIYMPDFKYGDRETALKYSNAPDYFKRAKEAIKEMFKQVGNLKINSKGLAERGLLVRHLVLPNNFKNSKNVLDFLKTVSKDIYVNIMAQYRPEGEAFKYKEISRPITFSEYQKVIDYALKIGLYRGFKKL